MPLHHLIEDVNRRLKDLEAERSATIRNIQSRCQHTDVSETDYINHSFGVEPPARVCNTCGLTEIGWGCGYLVLKEAKGKMISREEYERRCLGETIGDKHKGPLLRKEVTVKDLILSPTRF